LQTDNSIVQVIIVDVVTCFLEHSVLVVSSNHVYISYRF